MDWLHVIKCELDALGVFATISPNGANQTIKLRADSIRSERTGIHAAISVFYDTTRLAYDTFNVTRNEERNRLAKDAHTGLSATCQKAYPREALKNDLDNFCASVWDVWQEREPAIEIWTDKDEEPVPPKWLLEPFVLENQPNILFGERSSVKSMTALVLSAILSLQWEDNPLRIKPPDHYSETLYLDFERNEATARYNMSRLQRGMNLPGIPLHYKRLHGPLSRNAEWVRKYLRDHPNIKLIIIDSVTPASGGNLNETGPASDFFEAERSFNLTTLCLAHASNKDVEAKHKTVTGTFAWESYAGNVWECRKEQEEDSDLANVCLYHRKPPAVYGTRKPIGFRITFSADKRSLTVAPDDPRNTPQFVERMTLATRILQLLKHEQLTTKEISDRLTEKQNTVSNSILRLRRNGAVLEVAVEGKASRWGCKYEES